MCTLTFRVGGKYGEVVCFSDASWEQNSRVVTGWEDGPWSQAEHQTHKSCHPLPHGGEGDGHHGREGLPVVGKL